MENFILFGTDIVKAHQDDDKLKMAKIVSSGDYATLKCKLPITDKREIEILMDSAQGWGEWAFILKSDYEYIQELMKNN